VSKGELPAYLHLIASNWGRQSPGITVKLEELGTQLLWERNLIPRVAGDIFENQ
jgi:hypothetical protein